jgi:hypothetical protein
VKVDEIALTLPADDAFHRVAHLVLGGFADRHSLTVETLDDLTLALDTVLERYGESEEEVTVRVRLEGDTVATEVGAFRDRKLRDELDGGAHDALDLRRILGTLCDGVSVIDREGGQWIQLTKRLEGGRGDGA